MEKITSCFNSLDALRTEYLDFDTGDYVKTRPYYDHQLGNVIWDKFLKDLQKIMDTVNPEKKHWLIIDKSLLKKEATTDKQTAFDFFRAIHPKDGDCYLEVSFDPKDPDIFDFSVKYNEKETSYFVYVDDSPVITKSIRRKLRSTKEDVTIIISCNHSESEFSFKSLVGPNYITFSELLKMNGDDEEPFENWFKDNLEDTVNAVSYHFKNILF